MIEKLVEYLERRKNDADSLDNSGFIDGDEFYSGQYMAFSEILQYIEENDIK